MYGGNKKPTLYVKIQEPDFVVNLTCAVMYINENVLLRSPEEILDAVSPLKTYKRNIALLQKGPLTNTICMEMQVKLAVNENIRVVFVTNESDAVRILLKLTSMQLNNHIPNKKKSERDIEADITATVRQLPNVSKIKSWALLHNFKSIYAISTAKTEEIEESFSNSEDSKKAAETAKEIISFFMKELK